MVSFQQCDVSCGWIAAGVAVVAFGSFGVPLKSGHNTLSLSTTTTLPPPPPVHPLALQSYKTFLCFTTCWIILLFDVPLLFSWYGLLSGLCYVPGGVAGIYAIRNAGLAVAVGTWSSIMVGTSFWFGIIVFREKVHDMYQAVTAFGLLIVGLIGMAKFSSSAGSSSAPTTTTTAPGAPMIPLSKPNHHYTTAAAAAGATPSNNNKTSALMMGLLSPRTTNRKQKPQKHGSGGAAAPVQRNSSFGKSADNNDVSSSSSLQLKPLLSSSHGVVVPPPLVDVEIIEDHILDESIDRDNNSKLLRSKENNIIIVVRGSNYVLELTPRQAGIAAAVFNGAWGGLNLIPLHYAARQDIRLKGAGYLISYATGGMLVNIALWLIWYLYELVVVVTTTTMRQSSSSQQPQQHRRSATTMTTTMTAATIVTTAKTVLREAGEALPSLQIRAWGLRGGLAGLLYSIGNVASILAVASLGQSTGFSACMMQLFVSGLWGTFYFGEIRGGLWAVLPWFGSAAIAVTGIIGLSYQHIDEGAAAAAAAARG